jgi:endonuclease YncB( thermonuclease family)
MRKGELIILACVAAAFLLAPEWGQAPVSMDPAEIRVEDGDTLVYGETVIRIVGVDAPEIAHPEHGMDTGQPGGLEARHLAVRLLASAGRVEYLDCGEDRYGRTLAHVFVDGELLAVHLIRAGLAYETVSCYGDNGYADLADRILEAAEQGPGPAFEEPYKWRRKHMK